MITPALLILASASLVASVLVFIATCLALLADRVMGGSLTWLPVMLAVLGTLCMLSGGAFMVAESRSSGEQIEREILHALSTLEHHKR